jgi:ribose transport system permease protein
MTQPEPTTSATPGRAQLTSKSPSAFRPSRWSLQGFASRTAVIGLWIVLIVFYAIIEPNSFLQYGTFSAIFGSQLALMFLGLALVCVFLVGEFDLSVASNLGLASTIVAVLVVLYHTPIPVALAIAVASSVVFGLVNGVLIVIVGINAIVVTLGMGTFMTGLALAIANDNTVQGLPNSLAAIANTNFLGLPISFFYGVIAALIITYVLNFTSLGRHMKFIGANPEVARLAGVRVRTIRIGSYATSGLLCGIGGIILVSSLGGFDPSSSPTYLLPAFSAVFLGTAIIQPGVFNPIGTLVAIFFLATGILGLQILGFTGWVSDVFYGAALIIAVTVSTLVRRRKSHI